MIPLNDKGIEVDSMDIIRIAGWSQKCFEHIRVDVFAVNTKDDYNDDNDDNDV